MVFTQILKASSGSLGEHFRVLQVWSPPSSMGLSRNAHYGFSSDLLNQEAGRCQVGPAACDSDSQGGLVTAAGGGGEHTRAPPRHAHTLGVAEEAKAS